MNKKLIAFLEEMEKNLETFYVIDQRQFIVAGFTLNQWALVKDSEIIKKHETIKVYAKSLEEFNQNFKEYKEYEAWYASSLENKTPENARQLHGIKNNLDKRLKTMEEIIILAGQDFEKELLNLGIIKN